jgi:hypothetical protein
MRVIIAGSRTLTFNDFMNGIDKCDFKDEITTILSGTARGIDTYGEEYARVNNISIEKYPANWNKYGKRAGYVRNEEMAANADGLIAIWDGVSKGTEHMINIAKRFKLKTFIYIVT